VVKNGVCEAVRFRGSESNIWPGMPGHYVGFSRPTDERS
jgi:hypothetical protein